MFCRVTGFGGTTQISKEAPNIVLDKKIKGNVWTFNPQSLGNGHPATFPENLAGDHIISWSNERDLVYDCFIGSGTTAKMCLKHNRDFIGSEISEEYCKIAEERIKNETNNIMNITTDMCSYYEAGEKID